MSTNTTDDSDACWFVWASVCRSVMFNSLCPVHYLMYVMVYVSMWFL